MQTSIKLQNMFSYSIVYVLIILLCLLVLLLILTLCYLNHKNSQSPKNIVIVKPNNINEIKNKYLIEIDNLLKCINGNKITNRKAYQNLSKLIRNFIFEVTGIKVQNYTLIDIKSINMPVLYTLVEEYYHPEFAKESKGDIISSINKTREVILKWH